MSAVCYHYFERDGLIAIFFKVNLINSESFDLDKLEIKSVTFESKNYIKVVFAIENNIFEVVNSGVDFNIDNLYELDFTSAQYFELCFFNVQDQEKKIFFKINSGQFAELNTEEFLNYQRIVYESNLLKSQKYYYNNYYIYEDLRI